MKRSYFVFVTILGLCLYSQDLGTGISAPAIEAIIQAESGPASTIDLPDLGTQVERDQQKLLEQLRQTERQESRLRQELEREYERTTEFDEDDDKIINIRSEDFLREISTNTKGYYGYDLFYTSRGFKMESSMTAYSDYQVGPGDEIVIAMWGDVELREVLKVSNEGTIYLRNVGLVSVNGLRLNELEDKLRKMLSRAYITLDPPSGVSSGSVAWGDYDNDGYLDVLLMGYTGSEHVTQIYRNNGDGTFTAIEAGLSGVSSGSVAWGDYDNDGRLDVILSGNTGSETITAIYRNNGVKSNSLPSVPQNLTAKIEGAKTVFCWDRSADSETPTEGLSYNLYVGSEPGKSDIMGSMSDINTGYRKIVHFGNAGQINSWAINNLSDGTYYWSVQAVDNSFAGSAFAPEQTITITGIEQEVLPIVTELHQNYPNPFNPETVINYSLAEEAKVKLVIYDLAGREIIRLVDEKKARGYYGVNLNSQRLTSGLYIYSLKVDGKTIRSKKMIITK